jgi:hypothetical protein
MEQLTPDENLTMQLSELRRLLEKLQDYGEEVASSRGLHIHTWLDKYISDLHIDEHSKNGVISELFSFYDSDKMKFEDWQDEIALIPLRLLATYCYPSWETVTPAHIEKCLEIAGDKNSERHSEECFVTGDGVEGCFASKKCAAKRVKQLGKDLATGLTVRELISVREHDVTTMKRAKLGVKTIGSMFVKGGIYTEEKWEEFIDEVDHGISCALNPDMYKLKD